MGDQPAAALRHSCPESILGRTAFGSLLAGSAEPGRHGRLGVRHRGRHRCGQPWPDPLSINAPGNVPYVITVGAVTDNYYPLQPAQYRLDSFSSAGPTFEGFVKPDVLGMGGHNLAYAPNNGTLAKRVSDLVHRTLQRHDHVRHLASLRGRQRRRRPDAAGESELTPDQVKCHLMSGAHPAVNSSGNLAYSVFQQGAGLVDAHDAAYSNASGCANQGVNVLLDLLGLQHYGGRANEDSNGNFYIMAQAPVRRSSPVKGLLSGVGGLLKASRHG